MKLRYCTALLILLLVLPLTGCNQAYEQLQDGYYTAQAQDYEHGWKEFVTITVKAGVIVSVEYNAVNASGFIKSWDNAYMKLMNSANGTYPNAYTRYYGQQLITAQSPDEVDAITGATTSWNSFKLLAHDVLEQAKQGDSRTVIVDTKISAS